MVLQATDVEDMAARVETVGGFGRDGAEAHLAHGRAFAFTVFIAVGKRSDGNQTEFHCTLGLFHRHIGSHHL